MASRRQGSSANPFGENDTRPDLSVEEADALLFGDMDPTVLIADLRLDGGTQPRAALNETTIDEYADAMQAGDRFPPVTVFYDGKNHWLADGFHRVRAAERRGLEKVRADVKQGTQRDAVLFSVGVNAVHGLRRTNGDKQRAVEVLLNDSEWSQWSDREIARRAKVSNQFVSNMRHKLSVNGGQIGESASTPAGRPAPVETRKVQRGGTVYEQQVSSAQRSAARQEPHPPAPSPAKPERGSRVPVEDEGEQGDPQVVTAKQAITSLLETHGEMSPVHLRQFCGVSIDGYNTAVLELLDAGVIERGVDERTGAVAYRLKPHPLAPSPRGGEGEEGDTGAEDDPVPNPGSARAYALAATFKTFNDAAVALANGLEALLMNEEPLPQALAGEVYDALAFLDGYETEDERGDKVFVNGLRTLLGQVAP